MPRPNIRAGELRHRITIQQRSTSQDLYGGQLTTWTDFAINIPAFIRPLNSRELLAAQSINSSTSHEITIRRIPGVTAAMRAVHNGRYFNLGPPMNTEERNIELIIPATEGLSDG